MSFASVGVLTADASAIPFLGGTTISSDLAKYLALEATLYRPAGARASIRQRVPFLDSVVLDRVLRLQHQVNITVASQTKTYDVLFQPPGGTIDLLHPSDEFTLLGNLTCGGSRAD